MSKLFISHSSKDDDFVRGLRQALGDLGQDVWIDSRELRGGDPLWTEIRKAIEDASAYAIVVSTDALQSKWVGKELRHASLVREQRGKDKYRVIPISLNGTKLGVLEELLGEEPIYISASGEAGGIDAALHAILVALGEHLPDHVPHTPQPKLEPLEELVLELTELECHEQDGARRASARARLIHEPATAGQREVASEKSWRLIAPLGPIEAEELRWYLERYAIWPDEVFRQRAHRVEQNLVKWGRLLHEAAMPRAHTANVLQAWKGIDPHAGRRISIHVDAGLEAGSAKAEEEAAQEAATLLLGLPWELLHDEDGFLFQGAKPVRVRRRLPNTRVLDVPVLTTHIRILLVSARPEDEACRYLDHRVSARPLVEAMEELGDIVHLRVLSSPTLPALRQELDRARNAREPYHVVHFDGHGVYDRRVGLGGLCFEHPEDATKLDKRRHLTVFTDELGPLLRDHRIPLVFLEACQTAQAEQASESVASELLKTGVASVVAMSHSVLVETSRRFVEAFYETLASGARVGDAMLAGQRKLKDDRFRGRLFGGGELQLDDWFVPVLYQEKDDPQLFRKIPSERVRTVIATRQRVAMGKLKPPPDHAFVGRSRELLMAERLLCQAGADAPRYAVLQGEGGEGKTTVACELARWLVASRRFGRAAFVSLERSGDARVMLWVLVDQLVPDFPTKDREDDERALLAVERALSDRVTLIVLDNFESVLPPLGWQAACDEDGVFDQNVLEGIFALCQELLAVTGTRLLFTSRQRLPEPFHRNHLQLFRLQRSEAIELVGRVLRAGNIIPRSAVELEGEHQIVDLVEALGCHARSLVLIAPKLFHRNLAEITETIRQIMAELHERHPDDRERSLFASVELSLRRLPPELRSKLSPLAVLHGGGWAPFVARMLGLAEDNHEVEDLATQLAQVGLAEKVQPGYLRLDPALGPALLRDMDTTQREAAEATWAEVMAEELAYLIARQHTNPVLVNQVLLLDFPNLLAGLEFSLRKAEHGAATPSKEREPPFFFRDIVERATSLEFLLLRLGRTRALARATAIRAKASASEPGYRARIAGAQAEVERLLIARRIGEAVSAARELLRLAETAGDEAYENAAWKLAYCHRLLGRALYMAGDARAALASLTEAQRRFSLLSQVEAQMVVLGDQADCLAELGRYEEALELGQECERLAEERCDPKYLAVARLQLGCTLRALGRHEEARALLEDARQSFSRLGEPGNLATALLRTSHLQFDEGKDEAAEQALEEALRITREHGITSAEADVCDQLGFLYLKRHRPQDAVRFWSRAGELHQAVGDLARETESRSSAAVLWGLIGRPDDARRELQRAIECKTALGELAQKPWETFNLLSDLERACGNNANAEQAWRQARDSYLAYRHRSGAAPADGEASISPWRWLGFAARAMERGNLEAAPQQLAEIQRRADSLDRYKPFMHTLQAILTGSRDVALADDPNLDYRDAADVLLLLERLTLNSQPSKDQYQAILAVFQRVLECDPGNTDCLLSLGGLYLMQEQYEDAASTFAKAVKILETRDDRTTMANACAGLAVALDKKGESEQASNWYKKALTILEALGNHGAMARIQRSL